MATLAEVKKYWQQHPLHSFEATSSASPEFFGYLDRIKREDIEKFALRYWRFDGYRGKRVLDIGCGPGWFTVQYALGGANVYAVDLTPRAVELTKKYLEYQQVSAQVQEGNAEHLEFGDHYFDLVVAAGVLHHTPDTPKAIRECFRVLKPGGQAKIALYHKAVLHHRLLFPWVKILMRLARIRHPGADLSNTAKDVDDFIRQYDGEQNPVGIGKTTQEWSALLKDAGFLMKGNRLHYFPRRFIPFNQVLPNFIHSLLDRFFGTLIYFELTKPDARSTQRLLLGRAP